MEPQQEYNPNPNSSSLFQMNLDAQNSYNLRSSASWAKVLGVVGIMLGIVFLILIAKAMSQVSTYDNPYRRNTMDGLFGNDFVKTGLWIFVLTSIIFILGGVFAYSFGNKISAALKSNDQEGLNRGFAALRNYYAVRSITLIIVLLLFLLTLAGSM